VASVTVRNREPVFKLVTLRIQGRFRPPRGARWPSATVQARYEAVSQRLDVMVGPSGEARDAVRFQLPGVEGFLCTAHPILAGQERFASEPDPAGVDAWRRNGRDAEAN
jgi:hypothetical protein